MKLLIAKARNISYVLYGGEFHPLIEAVLTISEVKPRYAQNQVVYTDKCEAVEFTMTLEDARALAAELTRWVADAERWTPCRERDAPDAPEDAG